MKANKTLLVNCGCILALLVRAVPGQDFSPAQSCWTDVDAAFDFYPIKVQPEHSQFWSVKYYNSYKFVTNLIVQETYLLYQCGTEPPTADDSDAEVSALLAGVNKTIQVPVQSVGIDQTPTIPFLEYLGLVDKIVAYTSDVSYVASPCLLESIDQGNVLVVQTEDDFAPQQGEDSNSTLREQLADTLAIVSSYNTESPFEDTVKFSEYEEKTNAAIFEWIKYVALFFNVEEKANEVFEATQDRWECVTENAMRVATDNPDQPKVVWAAYSDYCEGWSVGSCPNYYCEYATQCSATMLTATDIEGEFSEKCQSNYLTTEQVVSFAKDADYWIYPDTNWDSVYATLGAQLDTVKAVQNKQVYDTQASGSNSWFEQRYAEYFAVLQDYCSIVGMTRPFTGRSWFRNVFDKTEAVGAAGFGDTCVPESRSNTILPASEAVECEDLSPVVELGGDDEGDSKATTATGATAVVAATATTLAALIFI